MMVLIHRSPDQVVLGASALSLALDVSSSRVWKIKENIDNHRSALRDVFVPLAEPLSVAALTCMKGTSNVIPAIADTTMALSITFASANTIAPISVYDYEVVGTDNQADADGDAAGNATREEDRLKEDDSKSEDDGIPQAEKKFKQLESDEELARKMQEEWEAEEERNRIAEENATNEDLIRDFDDIKARIEADRLLAERLQEQEREQFTIEERAKFLHDTIAAQRKFLAQQRSEAIRNRPPTKNQLRNQMMTYLKHVVNFKHAKLKIKKFEEVQALYEKIKRSDEDFISIGSAEDERLIKRMNEKRVDSSKDEMIKEESKAEVQEESKEEESKRKRKLGTRKKMKSRKRRYIQNTSEDDSDKENDELRLYLTIAPDEEKEVDYEILDRKYPIKE
ncbi:hypothetical protein Tco_0991429 [Tanacetum coccineum]|uniref:Uncharacterized protein n=1 Tax=Tanacetum coccineum TaxID=301880 RepID=A0ABQ5EZH5_9ASTR